MSDPLSAPVGNQAIGKNHFLSKIKYPKNVCVMYFEQIFWFNLKSFEAPNDATGNFSHHRSNAGRGRNRGSSRGGAAGHAGNGTDDESQKCKKPEQKVRFTKIFSVISRKYIRWIPSALQTGCVQFLSPQWCLRKWQQLFFPTTKLSPRTWDWSKKSFSRKRSRRFWQRERSIFPSAILSKGKKHFQIYSK